MKITHLDAVIVDAQYGRTWVFIEVHTDEGIIGIGEASQNRLDAGVLAQVRELAPILKGEDPFDLREKLPLLVKNPWHLGRVRFSTVSAIEQALWDICGKALGVPCYQLLGGRIRDCARLYANIELATRDKHPEAYADNAVQAVEQGFTAIKLNAFDPLPVFAISTPHLQFTKLIEQASARLQAVRHAVGDNIDILVDWSFAVPPSYSREVVDTLAEFNLYWVEEPFTVGNPQHLRELREMMTARLAAGEQDNGLEPFRRLLEHQAVDVLMPDVKWTGGITMTKKIATLAEAYNIEVAPHNMSGPISTAASAHIAVNLPNFTILEYCWGVVPWRSDLVAHTEHISDGHIIPNDTPGLGMDWIRAEAEKHRINP